MSSAANVWAWAQRGLVPSERLVLLALADDVNHQGQCWPARAVLAQRTELSESAIGECLKALESKGLIWKEQREGKTPKIFFNLLRENPVVQVPAPREAADVFDPPPDLVAQIDAAIGIWNQMAEATKDGHEKHVMPTVRKLNPSNRKKLAQRLKEFGLDGWTYMVAAVGNNAHCRGVNDRGWKADISYLLQPQGSNKTINGGWPADYEEKTNGGQRAGAGGRGDQRLDNLRGFDAAIRRHLASRRGREDGGQGGGEDAGPAGGGEG